MMTRAMHQKSAGLANRWPQQVDLSKAQTIMDVGAGSGIHVIEACRKFPNLQGTALDLPWITPITNEFIEKYGMRGRVKTASVDIFKKPLPNTDIIMMCDILHDWSDEKCNVILAKSWDALPSGGRIILLETLLNEDGIGPSVAVWFHLAVVKMLEGGQQRTGSKFRAMLKKAGFKDVTMTPSLSGATLIQAVKA